MTACGTIFRAANPAAHRAEYPVPLISCKIHTINVSKCVLTKQTLYSETDICRQLNIRTAAPCVKQQSIR